MPRFKSTQNILCPSSDGEIFDENWMDKNFLELPPSIPWNGPQMPRVEDVDIWEVILENSGLSGVYAAWCPYAELYIVTDKWVIVEEFSGPNANKRLENYLIKNGIRYPKGPELPVEEFASSALIIT